MNTLKDIMIHIKSIGGFSKQGNRNKQEDYILYWKKDSPNARFVVLCDGMGGHGHGEVASRIVAEATFDYLKRLAKSEYEAEDLQDAINIALTTLTEADIYDDEKAMGTTIVVVVINKKNVIVGHIGDSRCYLFDKNGCLKFRTKDHSMIEEAVNAEILTKEEAFTNPNKNILTRCIISGKTGITIDVDVLTIDNYDRMLLCSDGVTDTMRDEEIEECMINRNIQDTLDIIDSVCSENSRDNYSAILVDFFQDETSRNNQDINKSLLNNYHTEDTNISSSLEKRNNNAVDSCEKKNKEKESGSSLLPNRIFPLISFLLGAVLMMGYYKTLNISKQKKLEQELISSRTKEKIRMKQLDKFISEICTIDPSRANNDSVIRKDTIIALYKKYINNNYQQKNN